MLGQEPEHQEPTLTEVSFDVAAGLGVDSDRWKLRMLESCQAILRGRKPSRRSHVRLYLQ